MIEYRTGTAPRRSRLYRDTREGKILGVCAGLADYFGVETWVVRAIALIALVMFTIPTLIAYFAAPLVIKEKPRDFYGSRDEEGFWRGVRTEPSETAGALRHKFRDIERRMRAIEAYVTSREFSLNRDFRDLES